MAQTTDLWDQMIASRLREYVKRYDMVLYGTPNKEEAVAKTWDEAADVAAMELQLRDGWAGLRRPMARTDAVDVVVTNVEYAVEDFPDIDVECVPDSLGSAARAAVSYLATVQVNGGVGDVGSAHADVVDRIIPMVISRQRKYGTANILKFGQAGIAMRVHDKKARLAEGSMDFDDEKEIDAWEDVVGYAIVSRMLMDDTFELPLKDDVVTNHGKKLDEHITDLVDGLNAASRTILGRLDALEQQVNRIADDIYPKVF